MLFYEYRKKDIEFYKTLDFEIIGETHSEKFGFTNWYMVRKTD